MSLWHCTGCSAARSVGLPVCPQCGGTKYVPEPLPPGAYACETPGCGGAWRLQLLSCPRCGGTVSRLEEPMPHITVHGGPSDLPEEPAHAPVEEPAAPAEATEDDHSGGAADLEPEAAPTASQTPDDGGQADSDEPERPADTAAKARWVEYAVTRGLPEADAKSMTRAQLQDWEPEQPAVGAELTITAEAEVSSGGAT